MPVLYAANIPYANRANDWFDMDLIKSIYCPRWTINTYIGWTMDNLNIRHRAVATKMTAQITNQLDYNVHVL